MTEQELRSHFETAYRYLKANEGTAEEALAAVTAIKDFAKLHVAKPEQATLIDAPETKKRPGGY